MAISNKHFPLVSSLLELEKIPGLGSLQNSFSSLTDFLFYKDYVHEVSSSGDGHYYKLTAITYEPIALDLFGIKLILNPSTSTSGVGSEFPISLEYRHELLKYIPEFKITSFADVSEPLFLLLQELTGVSEDELLDSAIGIFVQPGEDSEDTVVDFINEFNTNYSPVTNLVISNDEDRLARVIDVVNQLWSMNYDPIEIIKNDYVFVGSVDQIKENVLHLFRKWTSSITSKDLEKLIFPKIEFSLNEIEVGVEFPTKFIRQVDSNTNEPLVDLTDPNNPKDVGAMAVLNFGKIAYDSKEGLVFENSQTPNLTFPKSEFTGTGITLEVIDMKLDLSRTTNIVEAINDNRPSDFVGAYITEANIGLPVYWSDDSSKTSTAQIKANNLLIGTGGVSGTLTMEAIDPNDPNPPLIYKKLGNFESELHGLYVKFQQNSIVESAIWGNVKIPGFKDANGNEAVIDIVASIWPNGEFSFVASEKDSFDKISIQDVMDITINSLEVGQKDDKFYIALSGSLDIIATIPGLSVDMPKGIEVKRLVIWEDGSIEIEGGALTLPKAVSVKVGPVKLAISAIHMGSYQQEIAKDTLETRQYRYIGFDGGISINPGGVDARGEGLKLYYTIDNDDSLQRYSHKFLRVDGIGIDIMIPGDAASAEEAKLLLKGYLAVKDAPSTGAVDGSADPGREFIGSVSFRINKAKISGQAAMRLNPDRPSFIVDAGLEIASPIPLGTTGLGIYGFRGLFGKQYLPHREGEESWWEYYKRPDEGINVDKFESVEKGFSAGAGVSLATTSDKGKAFSSKLFFLLGLPDVFLLQGQAAILKERIGLDSTDDPPFSALIAISKEGVRANFGIDYQLPASGGFQGGLLDLQGEIDMAFFINNAMGWYINIGKDSPDTERIQARVLSLFNMYAYLMLSSRGISAGAGASYNFEKNFGPAGLRMYAYIDLAARIAFKPAQLGGSIALGGGVHIKVFKFKFGFDVGAMLAAEAWRPLIVSGMLFVEVKIPVRKKPLKLDVEFTWIINENKDDNPFQLIGANDGLLPIKAVHMLTEKSFEVEITEDSGSGMPSNWDTNSLAVIPMDSFIDVEFSRSLKNETYLDVNNGLFKIAGNTQSVNGVELVPPKKGKTAQVRHEMKVKELKVMYYNGSGFVPYYPYEAVEGLGDPGLTKDLKEYPIAYWQLLDKGKNNRIRIMSTTMLSLIQNQLKGSILLESLGFKGGVITCSEENIKMRCVNWEAAALNTVYNAKVFQYHDELKIRILNGAGEVLAQSNSFGLNNGLGMEGAEIMEIYLPEETTQIIPKLSTVGQNKVIISYFERIVSGQDHNSLDVYAYNRIQTDQVSGSSLDTYVGYDDVDVPIRKIEIKVVVDTTPQTTNLEDLMIGGTSAPGGHFRTEFGVDDLRLYSRELTASEIADLYKGNAINTDQELYLPFDNSLSDSSGNSHTTSYIGGIATYIKDRDAVSNKALYFKSNYSATQSADHVKVDHDDALSMDEESYAISLWFKSDVAWNPYGMYSTVLHKLNTGNNDGFELVAYNGPTYQGSKIYNGGLIFTKHFSSGKDQLRVDNKFLYDGNWHHVVITCNQKTQKLSLYLNGREQKTVNTLGVYNQVSHSAYLHEVSYLTKEQHEFNLAIPGQQGLSDENAEMQEALMYMMQPVWRPNTRYWIQLKTEDNVIGAGHNGVKYYNIGFETDGPTGHFHLGDIEFVALQSEDREDEYAIATLKPYINYEASYPNPDGKLLMAKPLFYKSPRLKLFFNDGFSYAMFNEWKDENQTLLFDTRLKLTVKDPNALLNANALEGTWIEKANVTRKKSDLLLLENLVANSQPAGKNCSGLSNTPNYKRYYAEFEIPDLKPSKSYTAQYEANNKIGAGNDDLKPVHKHVFTTSRYAHFRDQIQSFELGNDNGTAVYASFQIDVTLDGAGLILAGQVVNTPLSSTEDLQKEFPMIYDRLMDGVLQMSALEDSVSTEINVIRDATSGQFIGILLRNPEPFIDPRIDVAGLGTIIPVEANVETSGAGTISLDRVIYNKDKSRVFITHNSLNIPDGDLTVTFRCPVFNGIEYEILQYEIDTVQTQAIETITQTISNS